MNDDTIKRLMELNAKQAALLKEYQLSSAIENCLYHLMQEPNYRHRFFLVRISDGKVICDGPIGRINSYINLRKLSRIFIDI